MTFLFLLGACTTFGKPFDDTHLKGLIKGKTTKLRVLELFGPPFKEMTNNGLDTWIFLEEVNIFLITDLRKNLVISFDKNNVVKLFRYTSNNP